MGVIDVGVSKKIGSGLPIYLGREQFTSGVNNFPRAKK
jgi:hypothetical protein